MCGIVGKLLFTDENRVPRAQIESIRGLDGQGIHQNGEVGLGHCRVPSLTCAPVAIRSPTRMKPYGSSSNREI